MLWQPKRILGCTFITVLAIKIVIENSQGSQKKLFHHKPNGKDKNEELWTINSIGIQWIPRPISSTHETTEKAQLPKHVIQSGVFVLHHATCEETVELSLLLLLKLCHPLLQPSGSGALFNLPWNQTKPNQTKVELSLLLLFKLCHPYYNHLDLEPCSICLEIKPNQTKQAKGSQQQKVPKQSKAIVKF